MVSMSILAYDDDRRFMAAEFALAATHANGDKGSDPC